MPDCSRCLNRYEVMVSYFGSTSDESCPWCLHNELHYTRRRSDSGTTVGLCRNMDRRDIDYRKALTVYSNFSYGLPDERRRV
jgi:hypothetical protein